MLRKILPGLAVLVLVSACSDEPYIDSLRKENVSYISLEYVDQERQRTLATGIWYPSVASASQTLHVYDDGSQGYTSKDQPISTVKNKYPLVLLSHGTGGSNNNLAWLAEVLASNGYIVAAPNHWNNTLGNNIPSGIIRLWDRPKDLSFVLSKLLSDEVWGSRILPQRITAAGFSAGGFTVLGLAGATYSFGALKNYCDANPSERDCTLMDGFNWDEIDTSDDQLPYEDERIKAVLSMAPAVGRGVDAGSLNNISIPVLIASARDDEWLPYEGNAKFYADNIPSASALTFDRGGHFIFMQKCALVRKLVTRFIVEDDVCDQHNATDRNALQHETAAAALELFGSP